MVNSLIELNRFRTPKTHLLFETFIIFSLSNLIMAIEERMTLKWVSPFGLHIFSHLTACCPPQLGEGYLDASCVFVVAQLHQHGMCHRQQSGHGTCSQ